MVLPRQPYVGSAGIDVLLLLRETVSPMQGLAIALIAAGVLLLAWSAARG